MSQGKLTASLLFAVVPTVLAACVEAPEEPRTEAQAKLNCGTWGCDSNSPVIESWDFHELHENALANEEGIRLLRLRQGALEYRPRVVGTTLSGIPLSSGVPVLSGTNLVGAYLEVEVPTDAGPELFRIYIKNVSNVVKYWTGPATTIETYELVYTKYAAIELARPLCKDAPSRVDGEGRIWGRPLEAILFTGDRYDSESLSVTTTSSRGWFNIGCAGGALAKLHLNRHTTPSSLSTHQTTLEQRQAMLKMYTADICGNGSTTTRQGEPLHWQNLMGWRLLTGSESSIEALWDENGAICMDHHRLEGDPMWSTVLAEIVAECGAPPDTCTNMFPGGVTTIPAGYLVTANP